MDGGRICLFLFVGFGWLVCRSFFYLLGGLKHSGMVGVGGVIDD